MIEAHQAIAGPQSAMLLGDSTTEQMWWNAYDNCRAVNAGFGGITAKELAERIATHVPGKPRYVWLMIGTNTANVVRTQAEVSAYESNVTTILQNLWARGSKVILVSIPPIDKNKKVASEHFSQARVNYMNSILWNVGQRTGVPFINMNYDFMDLNPSSPNYGNAHPWVTQADGVHLSRQANIVLFNRQLEMLRPMTHGAPCWG